MKPVSVGAGGYIDAESILALSPPETAPAKRAIDSAKDSNNCVDLTLGKKTRCVIYTHTNQIILSNLLPDTIAERIEKYNKPKVMKSEEKSQKRKK